MKKTKKALLIFAAIIIVFLLFVQFTYNRRFDVPLTGIKSSTDSAIIARGKYLVYGPSHCWHCHNPKGPAAEGMPALTGGFQFPTPIATFYTPNLTPDMETGIGRFTDEQLARALRYGVNHENHAMAPFMSYNSMSDQDIAAIISFLRSTQPVRHEVPSRNLNMLGKIVSRFVLAPATPDNISKTVQPDTTAAYGNYLASSVAGCISCHTKRNPMTGAFEGAPFSGGYEMDGDSVTFITPNLTPHPGTGRIYEWSEDAFVSRLKSGSSVPGSPMPWKSFMAFSDDDLKAIYKFLQTVKPVNNPVLNTVVPKK